MMWLRPRVIEGRRLGELQHTGHQLPQPVVDERPVPRCRDDVRSYPQNPASASHPEDVRKGRCEVVRFSVIRHPRGQEHPRRTEHVARVVAIIVEMRQNEPQKRDRELRSAGRNQARDPTVLHIAVHGVIGGPRRGPGSLPDPLEIRRKLTCGADGVRSPRGVCDLDNAASRCMITGASQLPELFSGDDRWFPAEFENRPPDQLAVSG